MTNDSSANEHISADRPIETPAQDLFGYAPFAKQLAGSICSLKGLEGLVIAVHGPWGSGKTTLLNLVRHYISKHVEEKQPIIVLFNPWWFSGQENIARAFLGQLQAVLPDKLGQLKKLGNLIGDYADGITTTAELLGYGLVGKAASLFKRNPKDVPELKKRLSDALRKEGRHILVMVDDIDRLTSDDLRQLFKVIKALADFPNVVYLLAFDKEVAVKALTDDKGISGEAYLEKIVQVPFELPAVDKTSLRTALFKRLDQVLEGTSTELFDAVYWGNIYHEGIDYFIEVPRDVVRLLNTLSVTYAAVRGEVNPVDFIAIESIRVFVPDVYNVVRSNPSFFIGPSRNSHGNEQQQIQGFHDTWLNRVPEDIRNPVKALMSRLFPRLGSVWSNYSYGPEWELEWRGKLRICSNDIFPVYFRLAVPEGAISKADLDATLHAAEDIEALKGLFLANTHVLRPDGTSKARALLERLLDLTQDGIPSNKIPTFVNALLQVGDELLIPQDENRGMFDRGNEVRVARLIYHLLKRETPQVRCRILSSAVSTGLAIGAMAYILTALHQEVEKSKSGGEPSLIDEACVNNLKYTYVSLISAQAQAGKLISNPRLDRLLYLWREWGQEQDVKAWVASIVQSDDGLKSLLSRFAQRLASQKMGDVVGTFQLRLNPNWLSPFLDVASITSRVDSLLATLTSDDSDRQALAQFQKEYRIIQAGKNPDTPFVLDED